MYFEPISQLNCSLKNLGNFIYLFVGGKKLYSKFLIKGPEASDEKLETSLFQVFLILPLTAFTHVFTTFQNKWMTKEAFLSHMSHTHLILIACMMHAYVVII